MRRHIILLLLITAIIHSNAQIDRYKVKHVKVYESTDSIISGLYEKGVDTLLAMQRAWTWEKQADREGNEEVYSSFILWADEGKFYYQRINEYAIYKPIREYKDGLLLYLLKYYFINRDEIDSNPIPLEQPYYSITGKSVKELFYAGADFNILSYRMGQTKRQMSWFTPNLRLNDSSVAFKLFNLKSYTWSLLIEREFRKSLNERWVTDSYKTEDINEISDFIGGMEGELKKWKDQAEFYKKTHEYERQELLIPEGYSGLIAIVQEQPCGKKISIKNSVRTIEIPLDGNLILDKRYISYLQEYTFEAERLKTSAFYVKGKRREALPLLTEKNESSDFGLSVLGEFTSDINSKKYELIVMYVGTRQAAQTVLEQKALHNNKLPGLLANCSSK
ncbi:MAG TPA: hypothetical protein VFU05_01810 [Cyclobacteriaceae bacterium]|nr:hypothetical protein [Cyclobacteriaceae bacterium]